MVKVQFEISSILEVFLCQKGQKKASFIMDLAYMSFSFEF